MYYSAGKARNVARNTGNAWNAGNINGNITGNVTGNVSGYGYAGNFGNIAGNDANVDNYEKAIRDENQRKRMVTVSGLRAEATGTFALHKKHAGKNDPEQVQRHKIMKEVAAGSALAGGGYVLHKHHDHKHQEKDPKKEEKDSEGKKHHQRF